MTKNQESEQTDHLLTASIEKPNETYVVLYLNQKNTMGGQNNNNNWWKEKVL